MANAAGVAVADLPWIRNARFDLGFILGLLAVAAVTGSTVIMVPGLFWPVLTFDLWFLGYHHVISTYTLTQAIEDGILVEIFKNRWAQLSGGKPIVATAHLFGEKERLVLVLARFLGTAFQPLVRVAPRCRVEVLGQGRLRHEQLARDSLRPEPEMRSADPGRHCFSSERAMISFITSLAPP